MTTPSRRAYLGMVGTLAAGGIAGCIGTSDSRESSFSPRRIENVDATEPAPEYGVSFEATLLVSELTPDQTAKFRLEWTNEGRATSPELGLECRPPAPIGTINERFHPISKALLVPDHRRPDRESVLNCWVPPEHWEASACGSVGGCNTGVTLDRGETIEGEFTLWSQADARECLPADQYVFGNRVEEGCTEHSSPFTWRLSFEIGQFE